MDSIGAYTCHEKIGSGGDSIVYRATHRDGGAEVAVKLLSRALTFNARARVQFKSELDKVAALTHSNILPVLAFGQHREQPFIVLPLIQGGSLAERIQHKTFPFDYIKPTLLPIAGALDFAHANGIVHGNVKPSNILFDEANTPLLTDFGLGQLSSASSGLTRNNALRTIAYASPEQVIGGALTGRSDVYSLAVLLWELIGGNRPFSADSPETLAQMHVSAPLPELQSQLDPLFAQALAKSPLARPATATALISALPDTLDVQEPIIETPEPKKKSWRNWFDKR